MKQRNNEIKRKRRAENRKQNVTKTTDPMDTKEQTWRGRTKTVLTNNL
jgi:hypothetical protein